MTSLAERVAAVDATPQPTVEQALARAWAAGPAQRQRQLDAVVLSQLGLARSIALRYRDRGEPAEDLMQVASMALVMAVQRYRPEHGVSFAAFAVPTVTGELRRHFRDRGWDVRPPRRVQELRGQVQAAAAELSQVLGRAPTHNEIAGRLDVDVHEVLETLTATQGYHSLSLDAPATDDSGAATLADLRGGLDDSLERVSDLQAVRPMLARLGPRDRHILALRYFRGCTQQEIADDIGVTQMQVSRLLSQALTRLRQEVRAED